MKSDLSVPTVTQEDFISKLRNGYYRDAGKRVMCQIKSGVEQEANEGHRKSVLHIENQAEVEFLSDAKFRDVLRQALDPRFSICYSSCTSFPVILTITW